MLACIMCWRWRWPGRGQRQRRLLAQQQQRQKLQQRWQKSQLLRWRQFALTCIDAAVWGMVPGILLFRREPCKWQGLLERHPIASGPLKAGGRRAGVTRI